MFKKVMIICLALSFVFIGGIGIALALDHLGPPEEPPMGPRGDADGSCHDFSSHDSIIIITAQTQEGPKSGHDRGPAPNSGDGEPDGPGWFIDPDSTIILAGNCEPDPIGDGPFGPYMPKGPGGPNGPNGPCDS